MHRWAQGDREFFPRASYVDKIASSGSSATSLARSYVGIESLVADLRIRHDRVRVLPLHHVIIWIRMFKCTADLRSVQPEPAHLEIKRVQSTTLRKVFSNSTYCLVHAALENTICTGAVSCLESQRHKLVDLSEDICVCMLVFFK